MTPATESSIAIHSSAPQWIDLAAAKKISGAGLPLVMSSGLAIASKKLSSPNFFRMNGPF